MAGQQRVTGSGCWSGERIGCTIAIENIFEEELPLRSLFEATILHCFATALMSAIEPFGKVSLEEWFTELGGYIAEAAFMITPPEMITCLSGRAIDFPALFGL
jgi:hypothetical protein